MTSDQDQGATSAVRTIGRYRAFDELGRGAMGVVYRGFDPVIGRTVALKTLALGGADAQAGEFRERLYREAAAAGALSHPGIVTIFDIVEDTGVTAVAMEYIEGRNLASIIEERAPLPLDYAIDVLDQLCAALDYAGSHGIVHRDIKPANILLTAAGRVKITDFGVARLALSTMTQAGTVLGSPSYMSPEQVRGLALDGRSDVFSATVVFYEMITRERPFAGSDVATTMYRIAHEPPTPPDQFNRAIGPELTAVLERALAKDPNIRFPTGADLVAELRRATGFSSSTSAAIRAVPPPPTTPRPATSGAAAAGPGASPPVPGDTVLSPSPAREAEVPSAEAIIAAAAAPAPSLAPLPAMAPSGAEGRGSRAAGSPPAGRGAPARTGAGAGRRGLVIAGSVAAVVVAALLLVFMLRPGSPDATTRETSAGDAAAGGPAAPGSAGAEGVTPPAAQEPAEPTAPVTGVPPPTSRGAARAPAPPRRNAPPPAPPPVRATAPATPAPERPATVPASPGGSTAGRGRVYDASQVDVRPVVTRQVDPVYPPEAARRGVEDVVILKLVVLASGRVDEVQVLRGSTKDSAFDRAAIAAVQQWEFTPALRGGAAVNSYFNVGVPFQLKK